MVSTFCETYAPRRYLHSAPMGNGQRLIDAKPLFDKLDSEKGAAAKLVIRLGVSHGRLANWRTRGLPAAMLPEVAAYLGMTTDGYLEKIGRVSVRRMLQPPGQYTIEGEQLLADFYALPDGLREHIARKTAELRKYADALPSFLKDALKPPTDPESYRSWEKDMEDDMRRRVAARPPAPPAPAAPKKRR
jgi:hypothetical protein